MPNTPEAIPEEPSLNDRDKFVLKILFEQGKFFWSESLAAEVEASCRESTWVTDEEMNSLLYFARVFDKLSPQEKAEVMGEEYQPVESVNIEEYIDITSF
ncbi:MAG: hypothetical protein ABII07_02670 [Patescibacteria group bacterium]|nr:Ewing's tumor-associated antigen 1 [Patescibacteria group bacterium]